MVKGYVQKNEPVKIDHEVGSCRRMNRICRYECAVLTEKIQTNNRRETDDEGDHISDIANLFRAHCLDGNTGEYHWGDTSEDYGRISGYRERAL